MRSSNIDGRVFGASSSSWDHGALLLYKPPLNTIPWQAAFNTLLELILLFSAYLISLRIVDEEKNCKLQRTCRIRRATRSTRVPSLRSWSFAKMNDSDEPIPARNILSRSQGNCTHGIIHIGWIAFSPASETCPHGIALDKPSNNFTSSYHHRLHRYSDARIFTANGTHSTYSSGINYSICKNSICSASSNRLVYVALQSFPASSCRSKYVPEHFATSRERSAGPRPQLGRILEQWW